MTEFSKVEDLEKKIASVIEAEDMVSYPLLLFDTHVVYYFLQTSRKER